jgi:hypothetical protein
LSPGWWPTRVFWTPRRPDFASFLAGPTPPGEVVSQSRNIAAGTFRGDMGVSFKMRKRRETGKDSASRGQRRRAARLHQSFPSFALHGCSREPLRPPHPSPKADHRAVTSSFLYFERDPHVPDVHSRVGTGERARRRDSLPGLPGKTMRRMVPFKELWRKLIAAWKTTSPRGVGPATGCAARQPC